MSLIVAGQILRQSSAIDFTLHRASRQHQLSHVSHENVTQSPNPFQHYLQSSGNFTSLASASPPNPPRRFAFLRARTALQMRLRHCPPISVLTTPYAFTPPYHLYAHMVPSRYASDTASHPYACVVPSRDCLPSLCSRSALPTCSQHHLSLCSRSALPTLLNILTLAECPPNTSAHPYACGVPSQHASDTAYHPYTCGVHSRHASDTAYHSYARGVHSRHAPDTAYHPYACGVHSRHAPNTTYPYASILHP
ncbi:hypothetical protein O181_103394 [Austropuccinia psidii MF-1]|uniref:Uncharacterized protein n=1 Tax=Austropuccinia psidii MF-1 TaxID=1389203 RepID=A0A9Q3JL52_9BASI|nr:hypothetical protein [Austropuccinia psidii MF-1]